MLQVENVYRFAGHKNAIYSLQEGRTSAKVISASGDGIAAEWNLNEGGDAMVIAKVNTQIFSSCFAESGQLVLGQMQGGIHVLDTEENRETRYLTLHKKPIFRLIFQATKRQIWAASGDGSISVWSVPDYQLIAQIKLSGESIRCMAMHPNNELLLAGSSDNRLYAIDTQSFKLFSSKLAHENSVFSLAFSPEGDYLLSGSRDASLKTWESGKELSLIHSIPAHMASINCIAFNPDGTLIATAGRDKHVKLWEAKSLSLLKVIDHEKFGAHKNSVNQVYWDRETGYLVSAGDDKQILVWKIIKV